MGNRLALAWWSVAARECLDEPVGDLDGVEPVEQLWGVFASGFILPTRGRRADGGRPAAAVTALRLVVMASQRARREGERWVRRLLGGGRRTHSGQPSAVSAARMSVGSARAV